MGTVVAVNGHGDGYHLLSLRAYRALRAGRPTLRCVIIVCKRRVDRPRWAGLPHLVVGELRRSVLHALVAWGRW